MEGETLTSSVRAICNVDLYLFARFVYLDRTDKIYGQTFTLATLRPGEEFTFQSPNADDIQELVDFFLDGLKRRSNYVIALQDYKPPSKLLCIERI